MIDGVVGGCRRGVQQSGHWIQKIEEIYIYIPILCHKDNQLGEQHCQTC